MTRFSISLSSEIREKLSAQGTVIGFSDGDLARILIRNGLDRLTAGEGIVVKAAPATRPAFPAKRKAEPQAQSA